ncbi:MAG: HypC/HybG/HupF family hydrogenase formation chaperone [Methylohalobius sp. ZOD2]|nr:HypC/HybG/HupF family hydrogenase formation chaperone [Methylothermaceae bacterium]
MCLGVPGKIIAVTDAERQLAKVDIGGVRREVNLACVAEEGQSLEACVGQWVLVHVGFALTRISAEEAERTLTLLAELEADAAG